MAIPTRYVRGDFLPRAEQERALRHFHKRFTREHKSITVEILNSMHEYPMARMTDKEWLRSVWLKRTRSGKVDLRCLNWRTKRPR